MKTINMVKVVRGSLQLFESFHGFYLYGTTPDKVVTFLGMLGDGVDDNLSVYNPNDDDETLSDVYRFDIVEVA